MLFVILFVLALTVVIGGLFLGASSTDLDEVGFFVSACAAFVAVVMLIILVVANASAYSDQLHDKNDAVRLLSTETIYAQRSNDLTRQIKAVLVEQYPQYEKGVIQSVVNGDPRLILLRFPDLQASKTLTQYTVDLTNLRTDVYNQRLQRQSVLARMRTRKQNGLLFVTALLPSVPAR